MMVTYYEITCNDCKIKYRTTEDETECEICGSADINKVQKET